MAISPIGFWTCWFLRRLETGVPGEKPLAARERTSKGKLSAKPLIFDRIDSIAQKEVAVPSGFSEHKV